jgi:hypothetical protein
MLRKIIVALAVAAMLGATMLIPTDASARPRGGHGGYGFHRGGGGNFHFRSARVFRVAPLYVSCWRWVPSRWGPVKIWVC